MLLFIGRKHHFESFGTADSDLVILLKLGRRRIFMPAVLILQGWHANAIKIATSGDCGCDSKWISHLHALWLRFSRHRKVSDRARKTRRRVCRQRLYLESDGLAVDLYFAPLAELTKRIRKERVRKWVIEIKQIKRRTGAPRPRSSRR